MTPLEGIRIVCFAEQFPGPYATCLLGDLGADVIHVERPSGDPLRAMPWMFEALNRGKRSITLDLKSSADRVRAVRLVRTADVVVEGFRPGVADRLGIGYAACQAEQPGIVYVSISGFGQDGPDRDRPAHDLSYQGVIGLLDRQITGVPDPTGVEDPVGLPLADLAAGTFGANAVLLGLLRHAREGVGSYTDLAMTDALGSWMSPVLFAVMNQAGPPVVPFDPAYGLFRTADDQELSISIAFEQHFWASLCEALDLDDIKTLDGTTRRQRKTELRARIAAAVARWEYEPLMKALLERDIPSARVNSLDNVGRDPQLVARRLFSHTVPHAIHVRQPLVIDGSAYGPTKRAPRHGEHTAAILKELEDDRGVNEWGRAESSTAGGPASQVTTSPSRATDKERFR